MKFKYSGLKVNGKKIDKHRHIIETHLKRKLSRQEVVHHKNGNTLDNSIDNLEVMSLSDHARLHMTAHF